MRHTRKSSVLRSFRLAAKNFADDDCWTLSASLAFYTLFALPPLLYLLTMVISGGMYSLYEQADARARARDFLQSQASQLIGNRAAAAEVGSMLESVGQRPGVWWKSALSLIGVLVGATGLMSALQSSLNRVWKVKPDPRNGLALKFILKRLLSLTMILGFGFVLLVSFFISSMLTIISEYAASKLGVQGIFPVLINHVTTFCTGLIFFAGVLKFMPDATLSAKKALFGGLVTVILFTLGRAVLFLYFQYGEPVDQLGSAAGSVAIILLWVYYSSVILLFGAEITVAYAKLDGETMPPELGAVQVKERVVS